MAKTKDDTPWSELPAVGKPEQVQQKLQISRTTFFRLVQDGKLPGVEQIKTIMDTINYYKYLIYIFSIKDRKGIL